ncbi:hypothetical protein B566_EDAN017228 [Ephemera danica]|nr:hypothetical protein B566_EDAN017228 [Ephemera danica]
MQLVLAVYLLFAFVNTSAATGGLKDGFNLYKDFIRGPKNDILVDETIHQDDLSAPKYLYFYRASPSVVLPILGDLLQSSEFLNSKTSQFGKRTNQFKNYMLTREPPEIQSPQLMNGNALTDELIRSLSEIDARPIPVRSSLMAKREAHKEIVPNKRALFSWNVQPRISTLDLGQPDNKQHRQ